MTLLPDLSTTAKRFRFIALLEAFTWLGLLIGMAFKYLPADGTGLGVKVFGPLHGAAVLVYLPITVWTAFRLRLGNIHDPACRDGGHSTVRHGDL